MVPSVLPPYMTLPPSPLPPASSPRSRGPATTLTKSAAALACRCRRWGRRTRRLLAPPAVAPPAAAAEGSDAPCHRHPPHAPRGHHRPPWWPRERQGAGAGRDKGGPTRVPQGARLTHMRACVWTWSGRRGGGRCSSYHGSTRLTQPPDKQINKIIRLDVP